MKKILKLACCVLSVLLWGINTAFAQEPFNIIATVAGDSVYGYNGDGIPAIDAELAAPIGLAFDKTGNLYIADTYADMIRMVDTNGIIHTLVGAHNHGGGFSGDGGIDTNAIINQPYGIIIDSIGNVYFVDEGNARIRKIDTFGNITTIAGTGLATYNGDNMAATAANIGPADLTVDDSGNVIFSDWNNNRIRKISTNGIITTIAGNGAYAYSGDGGAATNAAIGTPYGLTFDQFGNLFVVQSDFNVVRKINTNGNITTVAGCDSLGSSGDGGPAILAKLTGPVGIAVDLYNNIYICDQGDYRIRIVTPDGIINTFAGTGHYEYNGDGIPCTEANIDPGMIKFDKYYNYYFSDFDNNRIRKINNPLKAHAINTGDFSVSVFPNPNFGTFNISVSGNTQTKINIVVSNILGCPIFQCVGEYNCTIPIKIDEKPGTYFVNIISESQSITRMVTIY